MIFALPLYDDNPIRRPPLVTYALIGMCAGAFLWELGQNRFAVDYAFGMIPAVLFGEARLPRALQIVPPWATLLTSMFLHGGWLHIGGNMLFLWIFGNNVEDVLGRLRYLALYLGCGVVAALTQALSDPSGRVPMIGASGAIAGILAAYLVLYPRANVHTFVWLVIFFWIVNVPAALLLGLWFGIQFVSGILGTAGAPGVAFWAHIGGFTSGLVLFAILRPRGVCVLQASKSPGFAVARARSLTGRRTFHRGSVPDAGRRFMPPPGWS